MPETNNNPISDPLETECAIKGIKLIKITSVNPGDVFYATDGELLVLPDDCNFTSTILSDGRREYKIGENNSIDENNRFDELREYANGK